MLMDADNGSVEHLDGGIVGARQSVHNPGPNARSLPANEAIVAGRIRTEVVRQIALWRAPDRKTQKMPLRTRRSFARGTPRGLFGSIGLIVAHSSSVSS
jgi:hypothetical protein